jgi:hypothetical protein
MAGLNDLIATNPPGTETPTLGDDRIRALTAKLIEWAAIEHSLAGPHTFLHGVLSSRPAYGNSGRIYILEVAGVAREIQMDTGAAWVSITSNQALVAVIAGLAAHLIASPLDHPSSSVTSAKIAAGAILKNHLASGLAATTIAALVSGGSADALHTHPAYDYVATPGLITPAGLTDLADGWLLFGYAPTERTILVTSTAYAEYKRIKTKRAGNFKTAFTLTAQAPCYVKGRIYRTRGGTTVAIGTEQIIDDSGSALIETTFVESFAGFLVDDLISVYCMYAPTFPVATVKDFSIRAQWDMETVVD